MVDAAQTVETSSTHLWCLLTSVLVQLLFLICTVWSMVQVVLDTAASFVHTSCELLL
jgi:hypothetical protein